VGSSSPFTEGSFPYTAVTGRLVGGCGGGWVEFDIPVCLARCWVLRGHPCWVFFRAASAADHLTLTSGSLCGGFGCGWWWLCGGVWLFVECCIVDASILLW